MTWESVAHLLAVLVSCPRETYRNMCPYLCSIFLSSCKIQNDENWIFRRFVWKFDKAVVLRLKTLPVRKRLNINNNNITYTHAHGTIYCAHVIIQYNIVIYVCLWKKKPEFYIFHTYWKLLTNEKYYTVRKFQIKCLGNTTYKIYHVQVKYYFWTIS